MGKVSDELLKKMVAIGEAFKDECYFMSKELLELRKENEMLRKRVEAGDAMNLCADCKDKWRVKEFFNRVGEWHESGEGER